MEITVLIALIAAVFATTLGCFARNTRQAVIFLSMQAMAIGSVELMQCVINLLVGLHPEALMDFFTSFAEWFSAAVLIPLIIYWGLTKTENVVDKPLLGGWKIAAAITTASVVYMALWVFPLVEIPAKISPIHFSMLMFSISILLMVTRDDPLKILVGLNMAENALYPLFAKSPVVVIPFILTLMVFVTAVGVYIVTEAYRDYGTMSIREWRWID